MTSDTGRPRPNNELRSRKNAIVVYHGFPAAATHLCKGFTNRVFYFPLCLTILPFPFIIGPSLAAVGFIRPGADTLFFSLSALPVITEVIVFMKPIIGITPSQELSAARLQLNRDYQDAVLRAGAVPMILPLTGDQQVLDDALAHMDGVLFTGGADLQPSLYGEEATALCGETDALRDEEEKYLMLKCLREDVPFLAVCRGFEMMLACLGGTLYQDIAAQRPGSVLHPCYDRPADKVHGVSLKEGTLLKEIVGEAEIGVNSRHHQGAREVPENVVISAVAEDGLPEGIELTTHPFAVGVQWHPETLSARHEEAQRLFDALARQAETRHMTRNPGEG